MSGLISDSYNHKKYILFTLTCKRKVIDKHVWFLMLFTVWLKRTTFWRVYFGDIHVSSSMHYVQTLRNGKNYLLVNVVPPPLPTALNRLWSDVDTHKLFWKVKKNPFFFYCSTYAISSFIYSDYKQLVFKFNLFLFKFNIFSWKLSFFINLCLIF